MRVQNQQNFQITLSGEHLALVLEGLAELPFKKSNALIRYIQQQMQNQLVQAAEVQKSNEAAAAKAAEEEDEVEADDVAPLERV
jgi:hypothetical protein